MLESLRIGRSHRPDMLLATSLSDMHHLTELGVGVVDLNSAALVKGLFSTGLKSLSFTLDKDHDLDSWNRWFAQTSRLNKLEILTFSALPGLSTLTELKYLALQAGAETIRNLPNALWQMPNLEALAIYACRIRRVQFPSEAVAGLHRLKMLGLMWMEADERLALMLAQLRDLTLLHFDGTARQPDIQHFLTELNRLSNLRQLWVDFEGPWIRESEFLQKVSLPELRVLITRSDHLSESDKHELRKRLPNLNSLVHSGSFKSHFMNRNDRSFPEYPLSPI